LKKILLIRFSSIGDIVLTSPVIRALKQQLGCELHVLTKEKFSAITENNPFVDKVHKFQTKTAEISSTLKAEKFDFVVDLQKNGRSIKLRKSLALPSSSFPKLNIEKWMLVNLKVNRLPKVHIVDRYFEAVKQLGVKNDGKGLDFFIPKADELIPPEIHPDLKNGYIGIVIGGMHHTKVFPREKVCEVITKLELPVVLLGGKEDEANGTFIVENSPGNLVVNACGAYTLNQSASLVRQAGLIITNDTGLMHIAAAFKKPIISIWGNTVPDFGMYPYLPGNENLSVLAEVENLGCRPCSKLGFKKCPKKHFRCMLDQDVNLIAAKAKKLLKA
jgi:ADP-heptose:LPS heptosyltransferase